MAFLGKWLVAATVAAAAAIAGTFVAVQHFSTRASKRLDSGQLGKGPYRSTNCTPNPAIVERLAKVVKQLRDAAAEEHWQIDWDKFNSFGARAAAASHKQNYAETVREHCHAISFMMDQLRHQSEREKG